MRLAPAIALALVLVAPAEAAETVGHSALTAGPMLAGGRVLWADAPSGRPRVLANGTQIATWPAARTRAARSRIVPHPGGSIPATEATQLRIAGRYLAYLDDGRAVCYDLTTRRKRRLGFAQAVDVQADGTVATVRDGCVRVRGRRIARGVEPRVAIAGGRVLYLKGRRLLLGHRLLARGSIAGFDLAPDRAAWAVGPPAGRRRIALERL